MTNVRLTRKNMYMAPQIAEWYEEKAKETGMTQSSIMVMALSQYITSQKALEMGEMLKQTMSMLQEKEEKDSLPKKQ